MSIPSDIGIIDLFIGVPRADHRSWYRSLEPNLRDEASMAADFPIDYIFKDAPRSEEAGVDFLLRQMDKWGIERGLLDVGRLTGAHARAVRDHPDRFFGSLALDPNVGMEAVRALQQAQEDLDIKAASVGPALVSPPVPINDKRIYPIYAKCVELDIPICLTVGVPGPRVPFGPQEVGLLDEVCWFFPDLRIVARHGCEPWIDLAVKLLLKWPNLYYSTSAFSPKYYPQQIVEFANTRGAEKILYAGYYPMALSLERIMSELPNVHFREHVWPLFLRQNACRVFKLAESGS